MERPKCVTHQSKPVQFAEWRKLRLAAIWMGEKKKEREREKERKRERERKR